MAFELYSNNAGSTLNGAINNSTTSVVVHDASSFPATGNFRILIDSEIMLVTSVSSNTFTVTRGVEGTAAASHSDSAVVDGILTKGGLDAIRGDDVQYGADASIPASRLAGILYKSNNGPYLYRDNGSTFDALGPLYPLTPPVNGSYSWVNQGTASVVTTNGGIFLGDAITSGNVQNVRARVLSAPVSTPYTKTMAFIPLIPATNAIGYILGGMCFRNGSSGKLDLFGFGWRQDAATTDSHRGSFVQMSYYSSPTVANTDYLIQPSPPIGNPIWLKIGDDGTSKTFAYSFDGINFLTCFSQGRTTDFTADQVGFFIQTANLTANIDNFGILVLHWA